MPGMPSGGRFFNLRPSQNSITRRFMQQQRRTAAVRNYYENWMMKEEIPIHEAVAGLDDVTELSRKPWSRTGWKSVSATWWPTPPLR